jgi:hypothetical protein
LIDADGRSSKRYVMSTGAPSGSRGLAIESETDATGGDGAPPPHAIDASAIASATI